MESQVGQLPLTHRLWAWFEANRKQALWGTAGSVFAILVIGFLIWRHSETDMLAGEAFSEVASPAPGNAARSDAAQAYIKIANEYPKSPAGLRARLMAGATLFTDGKFDEARAQFERFLRERPDPRLAGQALLGIAACADAQGKTNEAISAYKNLVDTRPLDNVLPQAKFSLASLYEATGKPELARTLFEEVARGDPYGSVGSEAGMRLEELKKQHPELAAATNAPLGVPNIKLEKP